MSYCNLSKEEIENAMKWADPYEFSYGYARYLEKTINNTLNFIQWEIDALTDTIDDYIDDDREGNKDVISEFKEERANWKDAKKILNNELDNLYMQSVCEDLGIVKGGNEVE